MSSSTLTFLPTGFLKKSIKCSKCPNIFMVIMPKNTQMYVSAALCATCSILLKANKHLTHPYTDRLYLEHPHEVSMRRGHNV